MPILDVMDVSKRFQSAPPVLALNHIGFRLDRGDILCLLGPSGCGKTTLLRIIAGLETPDAGRILFDGRDMAGVSPHRRNFSMMFQEFALFPHKNVFENVAFGLRMHRVPPNEIRERTRRMLTLTGLEEMATRRIHELSGGERQRAALARSLVHEPRLMLLDEPLGSLDRVLRERLMLDIRNILTAVGATAVCVTHDHAEAFALADVIAVMHQGRIEQIDAPERMYHHPANPTVAEFLGFCNLLEGEMDENGTVCTQIGRLKLNAGGPVHRKQVAVLIRPDAARMPASDSHDADTVVAGRVDDLIFQGRCYHTAMTSENGVHLRFDLPNRPKPPGIGEQIRICLSADGISVMPGRRV